MLRTHYNGMVLLLGLATKYEDVVHVNDYESLVYEFLEDVFIIIWNVPGLLVRPKNMNRGSNRPWFIQKATFHSSPSQILTLLYPHWTSNLVKYFADTLLRMSGLGVGGRSSSWSSH